MNKYILNIKSWIRQLPDGLDWLNYHLALALILDVIVATPHTRVYKKLEQGAPQLGQDQTATYVRTQQWVS